jgi:8-oxo-dGTP pyrophosphatase MutT (NUDIX family)
VDFMAGAHVFPGGKLDAADSEPGLLQRLRGEREPSTAPELYVAAIRETFEEAGVLLSGEFRVAGLDDARQAVARGDSFASVLERLEAKLDTGLLRPWTRWVTPAVAPKRFDARFFLAAAPAEQLARHDDYETTESVWIAPLEALEHVQRGEMMIAPGNVQVPRRARDVSHGRGSIRRGARAAPPRAWCPVVRNEDGRRLVILSDDPDHPDRFPRMAGPTRMVFDGGRFLPA